MKRYLLYALISMFFAGVTSVLAKAGLKNVSSDTALAIRTTFVFGLVWINIAIFNPLKDFKNLTSSDLVFLFLSALATTLSWVFYYRAMKLGTVNEVSLIDKGSIVVTLLLSYLFLQEAFTLKTFAGAALIIAGLLILTIK